ncbi:MAG: pilus assembly protein PilP [Polyangiaceae bacterium]|nr:pilus assembly protein PilP [Polyangiaceae bacterium]
MKTKSVVRALPLLATFLFACSPDKVLEQVTTGPKGPAPARPEAADAGAELSPPPISRVEFSENDFIESDRNRDPFRSYASTFAPQENKHVAQNQRNVLLGQFSIDELKLVAIVTGSNPPRAMVVDPGGKGWVIKRGDFVGRPDVIRAGGANGAEYQVNWRVDRVRDGDVVFTREDPTQPGVPPASRVIALRPEELTKDKLITD